MENHLLIGKPSISMGHLYHGHVSHNQRVSIDFIEVKSEWFIIHLTLKISYWYSLIHSWISMNIGVLCIYLHLDFHQQTYNIPINHTHDDRNPNIFPWNPNYIAPDLHPWPRARACRGRTARCARSRRALRLRSSLGWPSWVRWISWYFPWEFVDLYGSMDWFKGNFTGKPHI